MVADHYQLHCPAIDVSLHCQLVAPAARLLETMLSGWSLSQVAATIEAVDIQVQGGEKYSVQSPLLDFHAEHKDLISTFNELLICIAYLGCHKCPDMLLIHAGAMIDMQAHEQGQNTLLLGGHKAGKSTYLARHCQQHGHFVSDDLLWINAAGKILGLGLPLRLRRPISDDIINQYGAGQLLAGHSLAYIGPKALPIYPAGESLHLDRVLLLEDYGAKEVPQAHWLAMIEQRIVPIPGLDQA